MFIICHTVRVKELLIQCYHISTCFGRHRADVNPENVFFFSFSGSQQNKTNIIVFLYLINCRNSIYCKPCCSLLLTCFVGASKRRVLKTYSPLLVPQTTCLQTNLRFRPVVLVLITLREMSIKKYFARNLSLYHIFPRSVFTTKK